jgi:hypothetical protein
MPRYLSQLGLTAAIATFAPVAVAAPVILNPSFEVQEGSLTYYAANWSGEVVGKVSRSGYKAESGQWSMRFVDQGIETSSAITGFTVGNVYSLTFWLIGGNTNSGTYFEVDQVSGSPDKWTWTKQTLTEWTQYDFRFMATAATSDIRFRAKSGNAIYLDTLELRDCSGTGSVYATYNCDGFELMSLLPPALIPAPMPLALIGLGLFAVGANAFARRRVT